MNASGGKRRRVLSYEERVLWTTVTKAIEPLRVPARAASEADGEPAAEIAESARPVKQAQQASPPPVPQMPAPLPLAPPLMPLGRRLKQRVARGKQAIDARLDLHGLTQAQAHAALLRFLRSAHARDVRLVLVITGKGAKNFGARGEGEREHGVLRRHVPQWLGLPEFRSLVVGFEDAHIAHGGEGALYVRLRRSRGA
jgi:DNA-nicking Smr family endonuclease